ncbi:MAG: hypothetical protein P8M26_02875 [Gammaproteobacteria bacterium]|nr:hypothetical protein [Gammaproteobacteria bacterium]
MSTKPAAGAAAHSRRVQLPPLVAAWVLGAHVYALLVPLLLLFVVQQQSELVAARADYPGMFSLTVLLMMVGSTFEITQNHVDRWYLTPETASANGHSTLDMLFFSFVVLSQAAVVVACVGRTLWLSVPVVLLALSQPFFYRSRFAMWPFSVVGLTSALVAFKTFGDPVILLQIPLPAATLFFFGLLLSTGNQIMHGFTTAVASLSVVFLAWGIHRSGTLVLDGWLVAVAIVIAALLLLLGSRRLLRSLPATPKRQ